ncbi:MAG: amidohydrolase family protein [Syntrophobacteraceae bacterium]
MNKQQKFLAGYMIDGTGSPSKRDVLITVKDGTIVSVDQVDHKEIGGSDTNCLDFSDCTFLPGLVDCHVHLCWSGTVDKKLRKEQLDFTFEQSKALIQQRIAKYLSYGVVALRDGGDSRAFTLRFKKEYLPGPECPVLKAAGSAWRAAGRYGKIIARPPEEGLTLAEGIARQSEVPDHTKIINSGLNSLADFGRETKPQFSAGELKAAIQQSRRLGRKVMVHANGEIPVREAIEAGCDSVEHGYFMGSDNIMRLADRGITWIPTAFAMKALSMALPNGIEADVARKTLDHQLEQIALARQMGVRLGVGTDSGGFGLRHGQSYIEELHTLMEAGSSIEEVIGWASKEGTRLLDLDDRMGRIMPGMPAGFIIVPGPPESLPGSLRDLRNVYFGGMKIV